MGGSGSLILRLALISVVAQLLIGAISQRADAASANVTIVGMRYQPSPIMIAVGDSVTWINQSYIAHTVTAVGGAFDSKNMSKGASFSFVFSTPGTYSYTCTYHPDMKGEVMVAASPSSPMPMPIAAPPVIGSGRSEAVRVRLSKAIHGGRRRVLIGTSASRVGAKVLLQLYSPEHFSWLQVAHGSLSGQDSLVFSLNAKLHRRLRVIVVGPGELPRLVSPVLKI